MKPILFSAIAVATTCLFLPAGAVEFHPITSVSSDRAASDFFPVDRLIEGPGIGFDANEPHNRTSGLTWVTDAPNGGAGDFFDPPQTPAARLVFDLGADVALSEISFWGYADGNANGANEFNLRFATAAEGEIGFGTSIAYNPVFTPTQPVTPRQSFPFSQTVVARYVELNPTDNFFGINPPGGDRVGIGEIAFENTVATEGPDISVPAEITLELLADDITEFSVAITNAGDEELLISSVELGGTDAAAFMITGEPATVGPLSSVDITLEFEPAGLGGAISATLTIESNDPDTPSAEILLTGSLAELDPDISVPSTILVAGTGVAQTVAITVTNLGQAVLNLSGATLSGPNAGAFTISLLPTSIAPLGTADIELAFDPAGLPTGPIMASLEITSNDPDTPTASVSIGGGLPAQFYPITTVTSPTADTDLFGAANLIQGIGVGFDADWPHAALGVGQDFTWVTNAPNGGTGDYFAPLPDPAPAMVFDLGQDVALAEVSFWGYADTNANGANLFSLRFATTADGPAGSGTSITYNPAFAPVQDSAPRQSFDFDQTVVARYVEWLPQDNFFGINPPGGDRIGAGEVAFQIVPGAAVPFEIVNVVRHSPSEIAITFTSNLGSAYAVDRSIDLEDWSNELDDGVTGEEGTTTFIDDTVPADTAEAFYRVRRP